MINLKHLFLASLFLLALPIFGQSALDYMEEITAETRKIQTDMWDYTSAVSHGKSARKVEKRRNELLQTSQEALKRVKNMPAYNGSTAYRDSVVSFLTINYMVLKVDYAEIITMETSAEKSYENMEAYLAALDAASTKMQESTDMVKEQQALFAAENNITLTSNENDELTKKMKAAGVVYGYYNKVYLIFFKSFLQESRLISALGSGSVDGIKEHREILLENTEEGLGLLKEIKAFNGDNSIVAACRDMLTFYQEEAKEKMDIVLDYYQKNKSFEEIQARFDKIKEKDRTQADVDEYNKAVTDLNAAGEKYNATTESLNKERGQLLETWNRSVAKFTDTHVPKGKA